MSVSRTMRAGLSNIRQISVKPSSIRLASTSTQKKSATKSDGDSKTTQGQTPSQKQAKAKKSLADADEDVRRAMEGLAGDGGEAGLELEDGKAVSMKRGVRENMFRYI